MRSLFPWISYPSKDKSIQRERATQCQKPQLSPPLSKVFKLKTITKHVSDYQKPNTPEDGPLQKQQQQITTTTFYRKKPQGEASTQIKKMQAEKRGELMGKAVEINSKFHVPLMKVSKSREKALIASMSLKRFQSYQKENEPSLLSTQKTTKFHFHPHTKKKSQNSFDVDKKMREFKQCRPFRSKWFTELKSMQ